MTVPEPLREPLRLWWERARENDAVTAALAALGEPYRTELPRVVACSEFAAAALIRDPELPDWLMRHDTPDAAESAHREMEAAAAAAPTAEVAERLLRIWRRRAMVRIAWRDIAGRAGVEESLRAVSDFADGSLRAATTAATLHLQPVFGTARGTDGGAVPLIVLGMGKLGGRELNFSSDIDLVFLYALAGQTDGPRVVDNEEYFNRLCAGIIRLLDRRTEDGFVFRVDARLRPFGDSGPLAISVASLEEYLQRHGRDWERYAWIKARPVVGADAYAAAYRDCVRPFVYRRYLDFGVFESLREMKALIAREVARRELDADLKLGVGGIREVEFIAQSFQLVRGGSDRRLQNTSLLAVLPLLDGAKLLSAAAVVELRDAYQLLRKAENALQMIRDEQVHAIPATVADLARLRVMLGAPDWAAASVRIGAARRCVAGHFEALLFSAPPTASAGEAAAVAEEARLAWLASPDADAAEELANAGYPAAAIGAVAPVLQQYRGSAAYRRLDELGRRRVQVIIARLLNVAAAAAAPAPADPAPAAATTASGPAGPGTLVQRVLRVLEAIGARSSYLALLKEQAPALDRLIEICGISGFLAQQIADYPLLLDELIDARLFDDLPSRAGFTEELAARTDRLPADDPERQVEAIRQFQKAAVFAVALADLTGRLPLMSVSDRLTDIAELIVERCMHLAWDQMTAVHGVPQCGETEATLRPVRIAVAGYGKLGGFELGYGSDLDLVFLHDSSGEIQQTQGARAIDNGIFFLRLGQRIVHLLTMHSAAGRLYEVDMRLRPNGKGGFLMTGIDAFERYQHENARTWEHQALLRARAVGGDAALCERFEAARRRALCVDLRRETLRLEVLEMRVRMRRELSLARNGEFDIKQDAGGLADIEFLVQYWVLAAACRHPSLVRFTDIVRQLEGLAGLGLVDDATADWLMDAYLGYRAALHRLTLEGDGSRVVAAAPHGATRARVGEIWTRVFAAAP
jgi:glutamate-ammonia-ligase adenylyltransferase